MKMKEVTEFFIIPPTEKRAKIVQSKEQFEDYLSRQFPGHIFHLTDTSPVFDEDEFTVMPLINHIDDEGKSRLCEKPSEDFINDIALSCWKFDFHRAQIGLQ